MALDLLPEVFDLAFSDEQKTMFMQLLHNEPDLFLGRVVSLDRSLPLVSYTDGYIRAAFSADFSKGRTCSGYSGCAIGDAVAVQVLSDHATGLIRDVLPRKNSLFRYRAQNTNKLQVLAANADVVAVVVALSKRNMDLERLGCFLSVARDTTSHIHVIFTKADRVSEDKISHDIALLKSYFGASLSIAVTSCTEHQHIGTDRVASWIPKGCACIFLGESGAGKSTLINALCGKELLETASVRSKDDKGRHTTVARRMVKLPKAGVVLDAPGVKTMSVMGHEHGVDLLFFEFSTLKMQCFYPKCTHTSEEGCALLEYVEKHNIPKEVLDLYLKLSSQL